MVQKIEVPRWFLGGLDLKPAEACRSLKFFRLLYFLFSELKVIWEDACVIVLFLEFIESQH